MHYFRHPCTDYSGITSFSGGAPEVAKGVFHERDWNSVFTGAAVVVVYSRARLTDTMHCGDFILDHDGEGTTKSMEGPTPGHETLRSAVFKRKMVSCWRQHLDFHR